MPKITAENLEEHRSQVQQRVFDAFAELMAERSFDAISMAQLAARAGLGRTAIYHHFADREAVVVAFASHETKRYVEDLAARLESSPDPVERLRLYVRHHLETGERFHVGLAPKLYGQLSPEARLAIREHVVDVEAVLQQILRSGAASGRFHHEDEAATMTLVHACLGPRHLPPAVVETFLVRALGVTED